MIFFVLLLFSIDLKVYFQVFTSSIYIFATANNNYGQV